MVSPCLVLDAQPFSSGHRDPPTQSGRRHEMVAGHLHRAVQSPAQALWTPVQRPLQSPDCGWQWQRVSQERLRLRTLESGAGQDAQSETEAGSISVEQPAFVSAIVPETTGLAACGAVVGRAWNPPRQQERAAGVWAAHGTASPGAERVWAIQTVAAGLVFWRQGVSQGVTGANERTNGGTSLRGRTGVNGTGTGGGDSTGGIEAVGVEGGRLGGAAQGRSGETEAGGPPASRNDRDREMDSAATADGDLDAP